MPCYYFSPIPFMNSSTHTQCAPPPEKKKKALPYNDILFIVVSSSFGFGFGRPGACSGVGLMKGGRGCECIEWPAINIVALVLDRLVWLSPLKELLINVGREGWLGRKIDECSADGYFV